MSYHVAACDEGPGMFAHFLTGISLLLVAAMLPFSLIFVVKVVQVIIKFHHIPMQLLNHCQVHLFKVCIGIYYSLQFSHIEINGCHQNLF